MKLAAFALSLLALTACPRAEAPPPRDASVGVPPPVWQGDDDASRACRHLQALACPIGDDPNCHEVFSLDPKFGMDPGCVLRATTIPALKACRVGCY